MYFCCINLLGTSSYDFIIKNIAIRSDNKGPSLGNLPRIGVINGQNAFGNIKPFFKDITGDFTLDDIVTNNETDYKSLTGFSGRLCDLRHPLALITIFTDGSSVAFLPNSNNRGVSVDVIYEETIEFNYKNNCMIETDGEMVDPYLQSIIKFKGNMTFGSTVNYRNNKYFVVSCMVGSDGKDECTAVYSEAILQIGYGISSGGFVKVTNNFGYSLKWEDGRYEFYSNIEGFVDQTIVTFPIPFISFPNIMTSIVEFDSNSYTQNGVSSDYFGASNITLTNCRIRAKTASNYRSKITATGFWK